MELKIAADAGSCCTASTPVDASNGVDTEPKSTCTHPPDPADTLHSSGGTAKDAHAGAYCDLHLDVELKLVADTASCWTTSTPVGTSDGVDKAPTSTSTPTFDPPDTLHSSDDTAENAHTAAYGDLHLKVELRRAADSGSYSATSTHVDASDGVETAPKSTCTNPPDPPDTLHSSGDTAEDAHTAAYGDLHLDVGLKIAADAGSYCTASKLVETGDGVDTAPTITSTHTPPPSDTLNANRAPRHVELVVKAQEKKNRARRKSASTVKTLMKNPQCQRLPLSDAR